MKMKLGDKIAEKQQEQMGIAEKLVKADAIRDVKTQLNDIKENLNSVLAIELATNLLRDLYILQAIEFDECFHRGIVRVNYSESNNEMETYIVELSDAFDETISVRVNEGVVYIKEDSSLARVLNMMHDCGIWLEAIVNCGGELSDNELSNLICETLRETVDEELMELF